MDIWSWVRARRKELLAEGNSRLAELLYALPDHVVDLRHHQVDALVPEAIALSRARKDPWLELFFRHWDLQSRVLTRMHGESALSSAVDLVDFAHRPETEGCPQSVCTIQDLAACYGIVDGPGWAPERIEVTHETLARIDPTWGCFDCISAEHADALRDGGRLEEAEAFLQRQIAAKLAKDPNDELDRFCGMTRVSILSDLGRNDEALALVERQLAGREDSVNRTLLRRAHKARVLARMGRADEAVKALPTLAEFVDAIDGYDLWSDAALLLVRAGALANDSALGFSIGTMVSRLDKNGAVRSTLHVAERHLELSVARGAVWSARRSLATMERCLPRLRKELDALDRVQKARALLAQREGSLSIELPESADALLASLGDATEARDADRDLPVLEAARAKWPEHEPLLLSLSSALYAAGAREDAIALLEERVRSSEPTEDVVLRLGNMLLREESARFAAYEALIHARSSREEIKVLPGFLRGASALEQERWSEARDGLRPAVEARADGFNARRMLARALLRAGEDGAREALSRLSEIEAGGELARNDHWDRMSAATIVGDWATVRASARALGLDVLEGEGAIDERWELCVLAVEDEDGIHELIAGRTGPATARVLHVAGPGEEQRFGDVWVFDTRPLNRAPEPDADEETRRRHRWKYSAVHRLHRGDFRVVELDGARPSPEQYERFAIALEARGIEVRQGGGDQYRLKDPRDSAAEIPAIYVRLAVPGSIDDRSLSALLDAATDGFELPLTWPALAESVGDAALIEAHRARSNAYGVEL
ncbi:MAG: hypothetical protein U0269_17840 [Polyangiales bacterium]